MNWVSNIVNLFSDFYYVSDIEFAKIQGEQLGRLITVVVVFVVTWHRGGGGVVCHGGVVYHGGHVLTRCCIVVLAVCFVTWRLGGGV